MSPFKIGPVTNWLPFFVALVLFGALKYIKLSKRVSLRNFIFLIPLYIEGNLDVSVTRSEKRYTTDELLQ
jgi:hypothetical protein